MSLLDQIGACSTGLQAPRKQEIVLCKRNMRLIGGASEHARAASVVIAMPLHNQARTLRAALESALAQKLSSGHCAIVLLDDQSTDDWQHEAQDLLCHPAVIVLQAHCGTAAHARNAILDFVESELPGAKWIARLDPDDLLCAELSIDSLRLAGERRDASFVIGSNYLIQHGKPVYPDNIANPDILLDREKLAKFIEDFCLGRANNELPSCNLLIRAGRGIRYPLLKSAEDHWLVAQLLMFRPEQAAVIPYPVYSCYTLEGATTTGNQRSGAHHQTRERLARAARVWLSALAHPGEILGYGMEGCVRKHGDAVIKHFYQGAVTAEKLSQLSDVSRKTNGRLPAFEWSSDDKGLISSRYGWTQLDPIGLSIGDTELQSFLLDLARAGVVASNIKRDNLRLDSGRLLYIDIGSDIRAFSPSLFLDSAARLYAICVLNMADGELTRRQSYQPQHESLDQLKGFGKFYQGLVGQLHPLVAIPCEAPFILKTAPDVTLMIKVCPQDHASLTEQVGHIVGQLSRPRTFSKVVLAIDPYVGTYLRQYADGDLHALLKGAELLLDAGTIDAIWMAPQIPALIDDVFTRWFGISGIRSTHTYDGAPLFAQLWAFEQVSTRYVLQADLDVLIGRKDSSHDYLSEMVAEIQHENIWCVGFNIAKETSGFSPYASRAEGFAPEIRLGLLDLQKIRNKLPLPNNSRDGRILKMWHRSMQQAQRTCEMQSVRGGDDRTFYIHPLNEAKGNGNLEVMRDLIGQGIYPRAQAELWDLVCDVPWRYPSRTESVVFLLKGRNTPREKLLRCLASLKCQTDQDFGVIVIDDASDALFSWSLGDALGVLRQRTTLVRRRTHQGYIPNFLLASQLCTSQETLIAVLDQDDALMSTSVVTALKQAVNAGADLINALMFRPNKPTRLYLTDYEEPRNKGGGNTWTHLRAFKKILFDRVPTDQYIVDGDWITDVSDYATMLPMAELAENPRQLTDQYYVWHDRPDYSKERKMKQASLIKTILSRPALGR